MTSICKHCGDNPAHSYNSGAFIIQSELCLHCIDGGHVATMGICMQCVKDKIAKLGNKNKPERPTDIPRKY